MKVLQMKLLALFLMAALVFSCNDRTIVNKFDDTQLLAIADLQDRRSADSLSAYLNNPNPLYRSAAAMAFASIQDSTFVTRLANLVSKDDVTDVRKAAAYAIGQTQCRQSEAVLSRAIAGEKNKTVLAALLDSYGRVASTWTLNVIPQDSTIAQAVAWAYYRMGVRGVSDDALNLRAGDLLKYPSAAVRLGAAHYFARGAKNFNTLQSNLIYCAKYDSNVDVRMAAALGLKKIKSESVRLAAEQIVRTDPDYRVRINALRTLQDYPLAKTKTILVDALKDSATNVGVAASEVIKISMTQDFLDDFNSIARASQDWRIQTNIYEGVLGVSDNKEVAEEIMTMYKKATSVYQQAMLLSVLQKSSRSYRFVAKELMNSKTLAIKSAAASSLVGMNYLKNFDKQLQEEFATFYKTAILQGDPAVTGIIAGALADSTLNYPSVIHDFSFLTEARGRLKLPKDYEFIVPLDLAIAYFEGRKVTPQPQNEFNHPVPWDMVKKIPRDQKAVIKTSKGDITIQLFVEEVPGSVANFISLALKKFYNGKSFHRVVPNFVVQGGCPRGDGWGSEDYSIRSEFFDRRYVTGSVGMASAGKDTEGTQWFITHSATPHLEGRYSLFATVLNGMDVVHKIEVGDRILSIDIINFR